MASRHHRTHKPARITLVLLLGLAGGCMQVETRVQLNEDGSAVITEKVRLSRRLLDQSGPEGSDRDVASLLKKETAQARVAMMGEGAELASHEINRTDEGGQEAVAVFRIPDLCKLRYASPFVCQKDYKENTVIAFAIDAVKKGSYLGDKAGDLRLRIMPVAALEGGEKEVNEQPAEHAAATPAELQRLRRLQPIFCDLLQGFKMKFTFESYAPIRCSFAMRGFELEGAIKEVDLIDIDDRNLDSQGGAFFENEEVMLDLARWRLDTPVLRRQLANANVNKALPILMPRAGAIWFQPSRPLYDRYLKDVSLDFGSGESGSDIRKAAFEEVGYKPVQEKKTEPADAAP